MLRQLPKRQWQLNALRPLVTREIRAMSSSRDISSNDHAILVRLDLRVVVAVGQSEITLASNPDEDSVWDVSRSAEPAW